MKTFSAQPGPSALLGYCKIRPGFEASFTIKPGLYAYGALLCALTERKTERELARARISVVFRNNMTSSNKCAKNVLVLYMYKYGPLRSLHGHGASRSFFLNFQGGDSCTFSQGFRRFSENLRWPSRDEMAGCLHGELHAFSSRDKFQLGHLDRVETYLSRARHVNTLYLYSYVYGRNRVELSPGWSYVHACTSRSTTCS